MDNALRDKPYPAYSLAALKEFVEAGRGNAIMVAEIERREAVAAGDTSLRTKGERLAALVAK